MRYINRIQYILNLEDDARPIWARLLFGFAMFAGAYLNYKEGNKSADFGYGFASACGFLWGVEEAVKSYCTWKNAQNTNK